MFNTFTFSEAPASAHNARTAAATGPASTSDPPRPKRAQVSRACDWCRAHRIKCDNNQPCRNCERRGGQCSNAGKKHEIRNLPGALKEIELLRQRVKQLETELGSAKLTDQDEGITNKLDGVRNSHLNSEETTAKPSDSTPGIANGTRTSTCRAHVDQDIDFSTQWDGQFFGPLSLHYFTDRIYCYLHEILDNCQKDHYWQRPEASCLLAEESRRYPPPKKASNGVALSTIFSNDGCLKKTIRKPAKTPSPASLPTLTRVQETYLLDHFWNSWHACYQILEEGQFREHYDSLWSNAAQPHRDPSPIVDIIIALCLRFGAGAPAPTFDTSLPSPPMDEQAAAADNTTTGGTSRPPSSPSPSSIIDDAQSKALAHHLYTRTQAYLARHLDDPTMLTLQTQFWSSTYLTSLGQDNAAYALLGSAIRTAHAIGIHLNAPLGLGCRMPMPLREIRRRAWWTLFAADLRLCLRLGRPWATQMAQTTASPPTEGPIDLVRDDGSSADGMTEVRGGARISQRSFAVQQTSLALVTRVVHDAYHVRCAAMREEFGVKSMLLDRAGSLQFASEALAVSLHGLQSWLAALPAVLKTERRDGGVPFSTDLSELEMDPFAPVWLRRQRLILELRYHEVVMTVHRPCIVFPTLSSGLETQGDGRKQPHAPPRELFFSQAFSNAERAARHAMAITSMLHQALIPWAPTDSDVLGAWHEPLQYQWNAALTLVAFVLAYSGGPSSEVILAQKALHLSVAVLDTMAKHFSDAALAAAELRELLAKADRIASMFVNTEMQNVPGSSSSEDTMGREDSTLPIRDGMGRGESPIPEDISFKRFDLANSTFTGFGEPVPQGASLYEEAWIYEYPLS